MVQRNKWMRIWEAYTKFSNTYHHTRYLFWSKSSSIRFSLPPPLGIIYTQHITVDFLSIHSMHMCVCLQNVNIGFIPCIHFFFSHGEILSDVCLAARILNRPLKIVYSSHMNKLIVYVCVCMHVMYVWMPI